MAMYPPDQPASLNPSAFPSSNLGGKNGGLEPNENGEVFYALEARKAISEMINTRSSEALAKRLIDEGLQGRCRTQQSLAARIRELGRESGEQYPKFSEIDVLMDETGCYEPLYYLCKRHGFEIPQRISPHEELENCERQIAATNTQIQQLYEKRNMLLAKTAHIARPQMVGGHAYKLGDTNE